MANTLLKLQDVSYEAKGKYLLRGLNVSIERDAFTLVLGPNGSGKSLFLRLCHGLLKPTKGKVYWSEQSDSAPRQTMVFQSPVMLRRSALDNITYALQHQPKVQRLKRAEEALAWASLDYLASRTATLLSLGEQQQLALARAWAYQPKVLFLDEPTASLDPKACDRVERLITLMKQQGTHIIMSTHNLAQAKRLGESIIFVEEGRVTTHQSCQSFFSSPNSQAAANFIDREAMQKEVSLEK